MVPTSVQANASPQCQSGHSLLPSEAAELQGVAALFWAGLAAPCRHTMKVSATPTQVLSQGPSGIKLGTRHTPSHVTWLVKVGLRRPGPWQVEQEQSIGLTLGVTKVAHSQALSKPHPTSDRHSAHPILGYLVCSSGL